MWCKEPSILATAKIIIIIIITIDIFGKPACSLLDSLESSRQSSATYYLSGLQQLLDHVANLCCVWLTLSLTPLQQQCGWFQHSFVCRYCFNICTYYWAFLGGSCSKVSALTLTGAKPQGHCSRFLRKHTGSGRQPLGQIPQPHVRLLLPSCKEVCRDTGFLASSHCINSRVRNRAPSSPCPPPENF